MTLDPATRRVTRDGEVVHLTPTEFDLFAFLAAAPDRVFTRDELLAQVWGYEVVSGGRAVDSHVRAVRRKLGNDLIRTVHGVGYALEETRAVVRHVPERPLDPLPSIKIKLSALIVGAVGITVFVFWFGVKILQLWASVSGIIAAIVALVLVRFLARGLTTPLREMAEATQAMAKGDYSRRVTDTSRDEIGRLARSFNRMAAELAETDRVRRDLVANVSHELRTPLTALQATLENIVDGVASADPETLRTMLAQVERLGRLVTQLLDLSRLEAGTVPLDRQDFAVEPLLAHAVREQELHAPGVVIGMTVEEDGLAADGDPERVHQVVANLLENAVRHSPAGGAVEVRARRSASGVTIEVIDEGPGHPRRRGQPGLRTVLPGRLGPGCQRRWCGSRPRHRPLDRGPPRRRDPSRAMRAARLSHGRHPARRPTLRGPGLSCPPRSTHMSRFATVDEALKRIRRGEMVLVADDEDRENEGDLTMAAEWVTAEAINFMLRWARGLVCMPIEASYLQRLDVPPMVRAGSSRLRHRVLRVDRPRRLRERHRRGRPRPHDQARARPRLTARATSSSPGHVFPLRARPGGVLERRGHTEAAVDLVPPRRPRAGRGHLRGAPRRRLARAPAVPRAVRPGAPRRDDLGGPDRRPPGEPRRRLGHPRRVSSSNSVAGVLADLAQRCRDGGAQAAGGRGREVCDHTACRVAPLLEREAHPRLTVGRRRRGRRSDRPSTRRAGTRRRPDGRRARRRSIVASVRA